VTQLPLAKRYLSDSVARRLYAAHKELRSDPDEFCPTCLKKGFYFWPDKETKVECDCSEQLQLHKHYLNAGIGALYQRLSFADFDDADEDMLILADKYLSSSELMVARGIGIILMGDFGTGKTLTATLILKHLLHGGYSVYSTTFANMIEMFTAGWYDAAEKEFYHERVRKSEILLIDDIGKEYKTKSGLGSATFDSILRLTRPIV
jgi:DNA replication protein DnaC